VTLTPGIGPDASTTVPVMVFCAKALIAKKFNNKILRHAKYIFFIMVWFRLVNVVRNLDGTVLFISSYIFLLLVKKYVIVYV